MEDPELAQRLAVRDPEAFAALHTQYVPFMLRYATHLLGSPEAAEDAVYELLAKWALVEPPMIEGPVRAYLLRSVYHAVVDAVRLEKEQTGQHPRNPAGVVSQDRRFRGALVQQRGDETDEEFDATCTEAYASLSNGDHEVLEMATRNMTTSDKAKEMSKTDNAFNKHLHDARGRLVKAVEGARARRAQAKQP